MNVRPGTRAPPRPSMETREPRTLPLLPAAALALCALAAALPRAALAQPASASQAAPPRPSAPPWSDADPRIAADVRAGRPLVIAVVVPLCDGALIDCGSRPAGRPGDLDTNLYWGAIFGHRRFFDRPNSGWERVERTPGAGPPSPLLERLVYRRVVSRGPWGAAADEPLEQILVLQAVHGAAIDSAVERFWSAATRGGEVLFRDGDRERIERIHVAGYAGHNRLMDRSAAPLPEPGGAPIPSFVMACSSEAHFDAPLRRAGSVPLLLTRTLMAPEGYVVDAIARALGDNAPLAGVRARAIEAYAAWQRLPAREAARTFAKAYFR